jgi:hypothetical protein
MQPCGKYAALGDLCDETESRCPNANKGALAPPEASPNYYGQFPNFTDPEGSVKDTELTVLNHLSHFCCQRSSQLICSNQALVEELDIIRRARFFEGEERSMLSYARAIAVSVMVLPCRLIVTLLFRPSKVGRRTGLLQIENSQGVLAYPYRFNDRTSREDIAKLPYLGTKLSSMARQKLPRISYLTSECSYPGRGIYQDWQDTRSS